MRRLARVAGVALIAFAGVLMMSRGAHAPASRDTSAIVVVPGEQSVASATVRLGANPTPPDPLRGMSLVQAESGDTPEEGMAIVRFADGTIRQMHVGDMISTNAQLIATSEQDATFFVNGAREQLVVSDSGYAAPRYPGDGGNATGIDYNAHPIYAHPAIATH